jgi:hypothetical protein
MKLWRSEWHDHRVPAFAHDSERVVASFKAKIVNVGTDRFGDPQPIRCHQTGQGMVPRTGQAGLDKEGTEFVSILSTHRRLLALPGSLHVRCRVAFGKTLFSAVPVEACHRSWPPPNRGPGSSAMFQPASEQLDVCPPHAEEFVSWSPHQDTNSRRSC